MNLPKGSDATITPYVKGITHAYQSLFSERASRLASSGHKELKDIELSAHQEKEVHIKLRLDESRQKLRRLNDERNNIADTIERSSVIVTWVFIGFLALLESVFTYKAFALFDANSPIKQLLIFWGLVGFFIFLPKVLITVYRETENHSLKWLYRIATLGIVVGGFFVLGTLRSMFLKNMSLTSLSVNPGSGVTIKPYLFVAINLVFLLVSTIMATKLPSSDDKRSHKSKP